MVGVVLLAIGAAGSDKDQQNRGNQSNQSDGKPLGLTEDQVLTGLKESFPKKKREKDFVKYSDADPANASITYSERIAIFSIFTPAPRQISAQEAPHVPQQVKDLMKVQYIDGIRSQHGDNLAKFLNNTVPGWQADQAWQAITELETVVARSNVVPCFENKFFSYGDKKIRVGWGRGVNQTSLGIIDIERK